MCPFLKEISFILAIIGLGIHKWFESLDLFLIDIYSVNGGYCNWQNSVTMNCSRGNTVFIIAECWVSLPNFTLWKTIERRKTWIQVLYLCMWEEKIAVLSFDPNFAAALRDCCFTIFTWVLRNLHTMLIFGRKSRACSI